MKTRIVGILSILLLAAGCATQPEQAADTKPAAAPPPGLTGDQKAGGGGGPPAPDGEDVAGKRNSGDLTRYAGIGIPAVDRTCTGWPCPVDYEDAYATVEVMPVGSLNTADGTRDSTVLEKRNSVLRWVFPKNNTISYSLEVSVDDKVSNSSAFLLLTRNDDDNSWQSDVVVSKVMMPLFKVEQNMLFGFKSSYASEQVADPRLARLVFQAAENIAAVAAPGSGIATALAKPGTDRTKLLIDNTLGKVFSGKHSESVSAQRRLGGFGERPGWVVVLYLDEKGKEKEPAREVARWNIRLSDPQPSVFSSKTFRKARSLESPESAKRRVIRAAYSGITPSDVLDRVAVNEKNETFRQVLFAQPTFLDLMLKANERSGGAVTPDAKKAVGDICKVVRETIRSAGISLTVGDESAVAWAVLKGLSYTGNDEIKAVMSSGEASTECRGTLAGLGSVGLLS